MTERLTFTKEQKIREGVGDCIYLSPEMTTAVIERLTAYEDTGKTPEDVALMQSVMEQDHIRLKELDSENASLRAQPENKPLTRCKSCANWDKSISFMGAHACAYWSPSRKEPRYTEWFEFCSFAEVKPEWSEG